MQSKMYTVEQCKKLDSRLSGLSDETLGKAVEHLYALAQLAIDSFLANKNGGSKIPFGLLPQTK